MNPWYQNLYNPARVVFGILMRVKSIGAENVPEGGAMVCANHCSNYDPFLVVFAVPKRYELHLMVKGELMENPVLRWILKKIGFFGVNRGENDVAAVKTALRYLKNGEKVMLFPEGTRVKEGQRIEPKAGAIMFALRTGVPLLPIYVPQQKKLFRRNTVVIGEPYHPDLGGKDARKLSAEEQQAIANELMDRIYALKERIPE